MQTEKSKNKRVLFYFASESEIDGRRDKSSTDRRSHPHFWHGVFPGFWQNVTDEGRFSLHFWASMIDRYYVPPSQFAEVLTFFCFVLALLKNMTQTWFINDAESSRLCLKPHLFWHHSIWSLTSPIFISCRHPFIHADIRAIHPSTADPRSPRHLFISACARGAGCSRHNLYLPVTARITDHRTPSDLCSGPRPHRGDTPGGPGSAQCWRWRWEKQVSLDLLLAEIHWNYLFLYL